jgi:hypothetical protein
MKDWLKKHPVEAYSLIFLLITLPAAGLYPAARSGVEMIIWLFVGLIALGNILVLFVK